MRWDDDPPYFMDKKGKVIGIDADLGREAMKRLDCSLTLEKLPWARALVELRNGHIDLVSGAYRTAEREQYAHYASVVGLVSPNVLFIRQEDKTNFDFSGLKALLESDFKLGAQINVSYSDEYSGLIQNPDFRRNIEFVSSRKSLWRMMARDRVDGVVASKLTGLYEIQQLGLSNTLTPSSLIVSNQPAYFIFSKASVGSEFVTEFDRVLQSMMDDGTFSAIVNRYAPSTAR